MILFAVIMFATAALLGVLAVQIYKGNTNLIHDYHQKNVTDKAGYGKAFGKVMGVIAGAFALSGLFALVYWMTISMVALFGGLAVGIVLLLKVQKRYNGGLFS